MNYKRTSFFIALSIISFSFLPDLGAAQDRANKHGEGLDLQVEPEDHESANLFEDLYFRTKFIGSSVSVFVPARGAGGSLFNTIATQTGEEPQKILSGAETLEYLKRKSKEGCVRTFTFAGHGWASPRPEGHGLPGKGQGKGLYKDHEVQASAGSATIEDLSRYIKTREIRFCEPCRIQIHSCNISIAFGRRFAESTGCQVFLPLGKCSPDNKDSMEWHSGPGLEPAYRNETNGFVRITLVNAGRTIAEPAGPAYFAVPKGE